MRHAVECQDKGNIKASKRAAGFNLKEKKKYKVWKTSSFYKVRLLRLVRNMCALTLTDQLSAAIQGVVVDDSVFWWVGGGGGGDGGVAIGGLQKEHAPSCVC